MRRDKILLFMLVGLFLFPLVASAQDTSSATPAAPAAEIQSNAVLNQAEQAAIRSQQSANDAEDHSQAMIDFGLNLVNFLGSLSSIVSVLIAVVAAVGGALLTLVGGYYVRTIQRAIKELKETRASIQDQFEITRQRLDTEIAAKQADLDKLREELAAHAEQQRIRTSEALHAQSLLSLGEQQYRTGDFSGALETYQKSHRLDTHNIFTLYRLGYVSVHAGLLDQAEAYLLQCLEIDPGFAQALATLGYTYRRIGEKLEAGLQKNKQLNRAQAKLMEALEISHRLIDDDGESWWGSLGGLYRRMGMTNEAIHAYQQAAEVTPLSSYPFSNLALLQMSKKDIAAMLKAYKQVETLALTEVLAQTNNYWAYTDLLTSRLAQGKLAEAEEALSSLFFTTPVNSTYALEVLLDTLKQLVEALQEKDYAQQIGSFIERIETFIRESQSNEPVKS